jgi:hypothetical protein
MSFPNPAHFPNLAAAGFTETSECTTEYNCFAWAVGVTNVRWDPYDRDGYWPIANTDLSNFTVDDVVLAYGERGFVPCDTRELEPGFEKVALYGIGKVATHAARQLADGRWTSKMGDLQDITHALEAIEGPKYGEVQQVIRRPQP